MSLSLSCPGSDPTSIAKLNSFLALWNYQGAGLAKIAGPTMIETGGLLNIPISLVRMSDNRNVKEDQYLIQSMQISIEFYAFPCEITGLYLFYSRFERVMFVTTTR